MVYAIFFMLTGQLRYYVISMDLEFKNKNLKSNNLRRIRILI